MEEPYLREVEIHKPCEIGGGVWRLRGLTQVTALFGKNGSGKSKLLREWRKLNSTEYHYVIPERAGEIDYQPNHLSSQMRPEGRQSETQRNFSESYRRQVVARIQAYFAVRGDFRGGSLPTSPDELEKLLEPLLPDFEFRMSARSTPPYILRRLADGSEISNIDQLSSGEAQILTLALDIITIVGMWDIQGTDRRFVLLDEPDAHIHPDLQVRFADFLVQVAQRFNVQLVVATHSTALLAALGQFAGDSASVLYIDRDKEEFTAQPFNSVLRELSACLGGHALMGPLFGSPLLLVEGDDDYRIWSQVPRYHKVDFAVIPGGGDDIKNHQKALEKIFSALRDREETSSGFALIDADKGKPQPNEHNPQNHIRYVQLACHESENLYLTDEVLASFDLDWESAQKKILAAAPKWGPKEAKLREIAECNRETVDVKEVIQALSEILDPKQVLWTLRVAYVLGQGRPTGQIADFLGNEVVDALWGTEPTQEEEIGG